MRSLLPLVLLAALLGCSKPVEETPAVRVENPALSIVLAAVPPGFEVENNNDQELSLLPVDGQPEGRVWLEVDPEAAAGINLVEIVNAQKESFLALPSGTFFGSRELQMMTGRTAYYSRGRFATEAGEVEEFRVSTLHPTHNRLMKVFYRYPAADDSSERLNDLLLVLGEIEAFGDGAQAAEDDAG